VFKSRLSSDGLRYPIQEFKAFWAATRGQAAIHGLNDFLETERKRVPGGVLWDAERLDRLLLSGYDPHFEGDESPGR
jgi:hypothetical protein